MHTIEPNMTLTNPYSRKSFEEILYRLELTLGYNSINYCKHNQSCIKARLKRKKLKKYHKKYHKKH